MAALGEVPGVKDVTVGEIDDTGTADVTVHVESGAVGADALVKAVQAAEGGKKFQATAK